MFLIWFFPKLNYHVPVSSMWTLLMSPCNMAHFTVRNGWYYRTKWLILRVNMAHIASWLQNV